MYRIFFVLVLICGLHANEERFLFERNITELQHPTPKCGDGEVNLFYLNEKCDDGNTKNGDGCNSECQIEEGWNCEYTNEGSSCYNADQFYITNQSENETSTNDLRNFQKRVDSSKCFVITLDNKFGMDLRLAGGNTLFTQSGKYQYYINPCGTVSGHGDGNFMQYDTIDQKWFVIGTQNGGDFYWMNKDSKSTLRMKGDENRETFIKFDCSGSRSISFVKEDPQKVYLFTGEMGCCAIESSVCGDCIRVPDTLTGGYASLFSDGFGHGSVLTDRERLFSSNGQYYLRMDGDGYLRLRDSYDTLLWISPSGGGYCPFQALVSNGIFRILNQGGQSWASGSTESGFNYRLFVQNDRNVVLYRIDGSRNHLAALWSTGTALPVASFTESVNKNDKCIYMNPTSNKKVDLTKLTGQGPSSGSYIFEDGLMRYYYNPCGAQQNIGSYCAGKSFCAVKKATNEAYVIGQTSNSNSWSNKKGDSVLTLQGTGCPNSSPYPYQSSAETRITFICGQSNALNQVVESATCVYSVIFQVKCDTLTTGALTTKAMTTGEFTTMDITSRDLTTFSTTRDLTTRARTTRSVTTMDISTRDITTRDITSRDITTLSTTRAPVTTRDVSTRSITSRDLSTKAITTKALSTGRITTGITTRAVSTGITTDDISTATPVTTTEPEYDTTALTTKALTTGPISTGPLSTGALTTGCYGPNCDCEGVLNGGKKYDYCGVCGGKNTTCCPPNKPYRCNETGLCTSDTTICNTVKTQDNCTTCAVVICKSPKTLCASGDCVLGTENCPPISACDAGLTLCNDKTCLKNCTAANSKCPPATPFLVGTLCSAVAPLDPETGVTVLTTVSPNKETVIDLTNPPKPADKVVVPAVKPQSQAPTQTVPAKKKRRVENAFVVDIILLLLNDVGILQGDIYLSLTAAIDLQTQTDYNFFCLAEQINSTSADPDSPNWQCIKRANIDYETNSLNAYFDHWGIFSFMGGFELTTADISTAAPITTRKPITSKDLSIGEITTKDITTKPATTRKVITTKDITTRKEISTGEITTDDISTGKPRGVTTGPITSGLTTKKLSVTTGPFRATTGAPVTTKKKSKWSDFS